MSRRWGIWMLVVALLPIAGQGAEEAKRWAVVGPESFLQAAKPLQAHRAKDGFEVWAGSSMEEALGQKPDYLLILGDDVNGDEKAEWRVKAERRPLYKWIERQRPEFVSDAAIGDRDGDGKPDFPVGRIPARSAKNVENAVKKILAFEEKAISVADLTLPVWAGAAGYGEVIDRLSLGMLTSAFKRHSPDWLGAWVIAAAEDDPRVGWPPAHSSMFDRQLGMGGVLGAMVGHGDAETFFSMDFRKKRYGAVTRGFMIFPKPGSTPPLVIFACDCGDFAFERTSLAEKYFAHPGGPVAVIAATTQSHPLPNYYSATAMLRQLGSGEERFGMLWQQSQAEAFAKRELFIESSLKNVEGKLEKKINIAKLKRDQLLMYSLLGDPATKLRLPKKLEVKTEEDGAGLKWAIEKPEGATALHVSRRPATKPVIEKRAPVDQEDAMKRFETATAATMFEELEVIAAEKEWAGRIEGAGRYRFVVLAGNEALVGVVEVPE